jgi:hypothetical protein
VAIDEACPLARNFDCDRDAEAALTTSTANTQETQPAMWQQRDSTDGRRPRSGGKPDLRAAVFRTAPKVNILDIDFHCADPLSQH